MESQQKVNAKLAELQQATGHRWLQVNGFNAITGFDYGANGQGANFNPGFGYPVKIFIDSVSGEMKLFPAELFRV